MSDSKGSRKFLGVAETAKQLGVHPNTVRNWVKQGILPSAKVPGTRADRFDVRDVERLQQQRGAAVPSVERERRTIGPEMVDGSQLSQWATTREAQGRFPELIRRLLTSTPGLTNISVRTGDGVASPGWDGHAESIGTNFLPAGSLAFEFGVGGRPRAKADEDYEKRRDDPLGLDPRKTAFVFVTPRRWAGSAEWAVARKAENVFADVKVLDADDLEGWLQDTPAVHTWISEQLGRRPRDVETLQRWWERFGGQTEPALPTALFLAGREREQDQLKRFFGERPSVKAVQAAWREDAIAFICATIERLAQEEENAVQPPLLVSSADAWDQLVSQPGRMTLLPLFSGPDLAAASAGGHHVLLPLGRGDIVSGDKIELLRPHRKEAADALEEAGVDSDRSYRLAALARRSMPAVIRELSRDPSRTRPPWTELPHASILAPAMLVGSWSGAADDTALVSRAVGQPYEEIERTLLHWSDRDDPPFVLSGDQWHLASPEEAFLVLSGSLTRGDLQRWHQLVADTLLEPDPTLELAPDERPMAGVRGIGRQYSSVVRRGVAEGIALMGAADEQRMSDGVTARDHARRATSQLLCGAASDSSGRVWQSLADVLPLLAEAAPDVFLEAVLSDLEQPKPVLAAMFQDGDQSSSLYNSSPHTGLLWALESLCWPSAYFLDATSALAMLQQVDPGGRLANRPIASLSSVLVAWIRQTAAPLKEKVRAVQRICRHQPDVGWELLEALWPDHHSVVSPPHSPRFRDWKPESRSVSIPEWAEYVRHLVTLAIELAGTDSSRWGDLAGRMAPVPPSDRQRLLEALSQFVDREALSPDDQLRLWESIRNVVSRHRTFAHADWSMDDDSLSRLQVIADRLEPATDVERFAYLFDWRPDLPDVQVYEPDAQHQNDDRYEDRLLTLRTQAVSETLSTASLDGVFRLARRARVPRQLGWLVAGVASEDLTPRVLEALDSDDAHIRDVASAWAMRKFEDQGIDWLRKQFSRLEAGSSERRVALALSVPARAEVWDLLEAIEPQLLPLYWERVSLWRLDPADVDRAVGQLLGRRRAWAAVDVLAAAIHDAREDGGPRPITPELVQEVLSSAVKEDPQKGGVRADGYEVGQLLDYLEEQQVGSATLAQYEFAYFRLLQHHRRPRALFTALSEQPELFVELVSLVYRGKNEPRRQPDEERAARASHAWWVLAHWRELPGRREGGTVDGEHLRKWVDASRLAFADSDRVDIGDEQIGSVLAASPPGSDGIWPAEAVRDVIETIGSQELISGVHLGAINDRGFTSRGVFDGGQLERDAAERYRRHADATADRWPRTSRMLRRLATSYEQQARDEDARAEITSDTE